MAHAQPVVKRTARAILLDGYDLIVIKRTKPGRPPYWITPGGGVEPEDATVLDALHREVSEELGAEITDVVPAFVDTVPHVPEPGDGCPPGLKVQHFFVCRLLSMDPSLRHGPEVEAPCGTYEIVRLPFTPEGLDSVDLVPLSLRSYLTRNIPGIHTLLARDLV
ncbi:NUDIX domain-containing protein [Streptomyces radicis]|uniref:NUDIX hydrolase n=1 Tax=Streptomyces radicis TaxID=1750517 RepID=A0A3A9WEX5_9ACTN|nr:NUDIX hydrolase [Streptomyces radicis]RKN11329.1 NUDIX hydrolase [Streptomyces radicis]RKN26648.1 NUDIX hydrolase [Streptomyces radicis]